MTTTATAQFLRIDVVVQWCPHCVKRGKRVVIFTQRQHMMEFATRQGHNYVLTPDGLAITCDGCHMTSLWPID